MGWFLALIIIAIAASIWVRLEHTKAGTGLSWFVVIVVTGLVVVALTAVLARAWRFVL